MLCKAKVAVCSEIHRVEILVVLNLVARNVTLGLDLLNVVIFG
jgi:hypothetical protein